MTFELSSEHIAARDRARASAQKIAAQAAEIDRSGSIPADVAREVAQLRGGDALAAVVVAEEVAAASPAVAVSAAATAAASPVAMTGLRGALQVDTSSASQTMLAAVALGIGRAATDAALAELRRSTATPGADVEKPHWVVADVATDLDAARLLTYKAAQTSNAADASMARLMAVAAAARAVDTALRVIGPGALADGHIIERLARDVRALSVLAGTEEDQRAAVADALFPR